MQSRIRTVSTNHLNKKALKFHAHLNSSDTQILHHRAQSNQYPTTERSPLGQFVLKLTLHFKTCPADPHSTNLS